MAVSLFACLASVMIAVAPAWADTRLWDGGGADNNAATGGNWCDITTNTNDNTAPASGDTIQFGGTGTSNCTPSTKNATWDILNGYSVAAFTMNSSGTAYTGTITLAVALSVTNALTLNSGTLDTSTSNFAVTAGSYSQAGGTFTANSSSAITINGAFSISSGTFNAPTTSGTVMTVASYSQSGATVNANGANITVNGASASFTRSIGTFNFGTSTVTMSLASGSGNADAGTSGLYNLTVTSGAITIPNAVTINKDVLITGGALTLAQTVTVTGTVTIGQTAGQSGVSMVLNAKNLTVNRGSLSGTGSVWCGASVGDSTCTAGTVKITGPASGTGTVGTSTVGNTFYFNALTIGQAPTTANVQFQGTLSVTKQLTFDTSATVDGGSATLNLLQSGAGPNRPFIQNGTFTANASTVVYKGTAATDITATTYYHLSLQPSGAGGPTYTLGASGGQTITANGNLTVGDGTNAVTVTAATNNPTLTVSGNVTINASGALTASSTGTFNVGGSWTNSGTFTAGTGTVTFNAGSTGKTITSGGSSFYNITFNNASGGWILQDTLTVSNGVTVTNGALSLNGQNVAVSGGDLTNAGTIYCGSGSNTCSAGTVTMKGTSATGIGGAGGTTFYNLTIGNGTTASNILTNGNFTVNNALTITSTTHASKNIWDAGSKTITLVGAGTPLVIGATNTTFTPSTSTIRYASTTTATVTGTTYNILQIIPSSSAATFTLGGAVTANGTGDALYVSSTGVLGVGTLDTSASNYSISVPNGTLRLGAGGFEVGGNLLAHGSTISLGGLNIDSGTFTQNTSTTALTGNLTIGSPGAFTKGTGTLTFAGTTASTWTDNNATKQDLGTVTINKTDTVAPATNDKVTLGSSVKATSVTIDGTAGQADTLDISSYTLTLTGSGTPLTINGTLTENTSSTVEFAATSGTTTVNARTYGGNLKINGSGGSFVAGGTITATSNVSVTAGSFSLNGQNLTVNGGGITGAGTIYCGNGNNTCSAGSVAVNGAGTVGGGSYTFYNLNLGGDTTTTTFGGALTVNHIFWCGNAASHTCDTSSANNYGLTVNGQFQVFGAPGGANAVFNANNSLVTVSARFFVGNVLDSTAKGTFNGGGSTVNLTGTDATAVLWIISGSSFNPQTGTFQYSSASGAPVTSTTYNNLTINGTGTFSAAGAVTATGNLTVTSGTLAMGANNLTVGTGTSNGHIVGAGSITATSGTTTLQGAGNLGGTSSATAGTCSGTSGTYTFANLTLGDGVNTKTTTLCGAITINGTFTVSANQSFSLNGQNLTYTYSATFPAGSGTIYCGNGNNTCSAGTVTLTSLLTNFGSLTFYNLTLGDGTNSGLATTSGGDPTVKGTCTIQTSYEFRIGAQTVTAANVTISGGTLSMLSSGGVLKISGSGTLSMSSGTFSASDVATAPTLTTSDTVTPTYVGVSLTGGTLNVAALSVDYLKSTGFVIGSGVTITNFNKLRWGDASNVYHGQAASGEVILDITGQTASLLNHVFPSTWSSQDSTDCNVRSTTSGVVTMWDWTGTYGGASYSCNNSGGEVVWKGGPGASQNSGSQGYPALY